MLKPDQKLAIHFFEQIDKLNGKMGHAVLRYSRNPVACAVDFNHKGSTTRDLLDFGPDVPVLGSVAEAADAGGEVVVLGMAPSGGRSSHAKASGSAPHTRSCSTALARSARRTSGDVRSARPRCSASVQRRLHRPGPVRPARPARWSAESRATRTVSRRSNSVWVST